jgi:hypothetical protein
VSGWRENGALRGWSTDPAEAAFARMLKRGGRRGITRVATPGGGKNFSELSYRKTNAHENLTLAAAQLCNATIIE